MRQKTTSQQEKIEQFAPFGKIKAKKILTLRWQEMRPSIRLAHRVMQPDLILSNRIIFDHMLLLFLRGQGEYEHNGEKVPVGQRHLLLIAPFQPHAFRFLDGPTDHVAIHFDWKS